MTDEEKLTMLKSMTEETDNDVLSTYLTLAKGVVLSRAYPYTEAVSYTHLTLPTTPYV